MAQAPAIIDLEEFKKLSTLGCTINEIANWFGVSSRTIDNRLTTPEYRKAFDRGRAELCQGLRQKQISVAMGGNVTMLIWLGKQILEQHEPRPVEKPESEFDKMNESELLNNVVDAMLENEDLKQRISVIIKAKEQALQPEKSLN